MKSVHQLSENMSLSKKSKFWSFLPCKEDLVAAFSEMGVPTSR